jgi:pyruvate/2-oxoglutarate dehydrogenase complex dihydrolipoamide acyltransferase (E2) component
MSMRRKVGAFSFGKMKTAMLTTFHEVNMTPINMIRNQYKDESAETWRICRFMLQSSN